MAEDVKMLLKKIGGHQAHLT